MLLVAPVSRLPTYERSRNELHGYVMAVISMRQLLADGLPDAFHDYLSVRILDMSTNDQHEVLFESTNEPVPSDLSATRLVRMADHDYQVDILPSEAFMQANQSSVVSAVVFFGGLLSLRARSR